MLHATRGNQADEQALANDRKSATHLIVHPGSVHMRREAEYNVTFRAQNPGVPPPKAVPYHWICQIHRANAMIDPETLSPPNPIFFHPSAAENNKPLIAWVSVNVQRHAHEPLPIDAQATVERILVNGGALLEAKRSKSDLLIIDRTTDFAKKVQDERLKHQRTWQRLAEREWVEDCNTEQKVSWHTTGTDDVPEKDDFTAGMMKGKGTGRPSGGYVFALLLGRMVAAVDRAEL